MKKLFFAVAAILLLSSCRNNDIETVQNEIFEKKLKTDEEIPIKIESDSTGIGPIVITPPR